MLYEKFNNHKDFAGADVFKNKASQKTEVLKNLNPVFLAREYQKEALGRFYYYCEEYREKQRPIHLLFNMATGSGKTLIIAANILYFYQQGYRNFIFFTRLGNIIQKTKANFLDPNSKKYLFADKIIIGGKEVKIKEVENFEGASGDDINIVFTTIANLHNRFNSAKENAIAYEDFADKKVVLLGDEAHNFSAQTRSEKEAEKNTWERTILGNSGDLFNTPGILNANREKENVLLEFTATAQLDNEAIKEKYKDKAIYRYDLKEYRWDGFSKEVSTSQIDAPLIERVLAAVIVSQYRRKVAEKHKIALKPVIMFKANRVTMPSDRSALSGNNPKVVVSSEFKELFHKLIVGLKIKDLEKIANLKETSEHKIIERAFAFFKQRGITLENLLAEIKADFAPEKCLTVDEDKDLDQKQLLLNDLENPDNGIRAIFATEKLNEGWDVLNLFDIVRLYDSRDARANRPGRTTVQEAQLIGRGARYCPFIIGEFIDPYRRKFDDNPNEELKVLEQLYYHSTHNPDYISELKKALVDVGIISARTIQRDIKIKDEFKKTNFWKNGLIFLNSRESKNARDVHALRDAKAEFDISSEGNIYALPTRTTSKSEIFIEKENNQCSGKSKIEELKLMDLIVGNIIRSALDENSAGKFAELKKIFGNIESVSDFISNPKYLGGTKIKIKGLEWHLNNLSQAEKFDIVSFALGRILEEAGKNKREYQGSKIFRHRRIKEVFVDKILQLDENNPRAQVMKDFDFKNKKWFAQNEIWGTDQEEHFMEFMDEMAEKLKKKYEEIALMRNEQFFKIYNFDDGEAFAPDFVLFLKEKQTKQEVVYQVFIEPKNEMLAKAEPWKEEFLLAIEKNYKTDFETFKIENKDFKLLGLPFFNETGEMRERFDKVFDKQLLS